MKTPHQCFNYEDLTVDEHRAIRALNSGTAEEYQQKLALAVIVKKLAGTHDLGFIPDDERQSSFMSGRQYVGHRILRYVNTTPEGEKQ